ncbi:Branched-chain amino acid transport system carrier protein [Streptococcus gallolyticus]|uniref:Branched-chain amino acid transport system carrier protein n=1 Tax=Streptococcus gallolyticus TaxID=315405 RepID=A0A139N8B4_9STRE|nr:branched-chain amino acid transport system II carrier protein [Streptococcus gallolyticus]KXT71981.1 Branched-chain amino acid transport system carrier protein [Streptococcus gallolyticus]
MKPFKNIYVIIGFMLFALFFGAGNLIYPAFLGIYSGSNLALAILGFCLTGVTLPLLGVVAVAYSGASDVEDFARPVSRHYALLFSIALYLSIGPFFAIPRTGATSFSIGIQPILGDSIGVKIAYGLLFFGLSYILAIKPSKIADRIGKYLTPALLIILAILVIASFIKPAGNIGTAYNAANDISNAFKDVPFVAGLIQGYGTMDALASLAFAIIVIDASKQHGAKNQSEVALLTFKSGIIATVLLALIYIFVARIGATSQSLFTFTNGQFTFNGAAIDGGNVLGQAAYFYLGSIGRAVLAAAIFLACLTTATGLITACAEYFHKLQPKLSHVAWASIFTLIALFFYFGGLSELIKWSLPVLYLLYPLTVVIVLLVLLAKFFNNSPIVYRLTIGFTAIPALYDAFSTLSTMTGLFTLPTSLVEFFTTIVPFGQFSMGWISFALVGFILSILITKVKKT